MLYGQGRLCCPHTALDKRKRERNVIATPLTLLWKALAKENK
jgi:hypothetical protein